MTRHTPLLSRLLLTASEVATSLRPIENALNRLRRLEEGCRNTDYTEMLRDQLRQERHTLRCLTISAKLAIEKADRQLSALSFLEGIEQESAGDTELVFTKLAGSPDWTEVAVEGTTVLYGGDDQGTYIAPPGVYLWVEMAVTGEPGDVATVSVSNSSSSSLVLEIPADKFQASAGHWLLVN